MELNKSFVSLKHFNLLLYLQVVSYYYRMFIASIAEIKIARKPLLVIIPGFVLVDISTVTRGYEMFHNYYFRFIYVIPFSLRANYTTMLTAQ